MGAIQLGWGEFHKKSSLYPITYLFSFESETQFIIEKVVYIGFGT